MFAGAQIMLEFIVSACYSTQITNQQRMKSSKKGRIFMHRDRKSCTHDDDNGPLTAPALKKAPMTILALSAESIHTRAHTQKIRSTLRAYINNPWMKRHFVIVASTKIVATFAPAHSILSLPFQNSEMPHALQKYVCICKYCVLSKAVD